MSVITINTRLIFSIILTLLLLIILVACNPESVITSPVPTLTPLLPTHTALPIAPTSIPSLTPEPIASKYSFEDELNGWTAQTYTNIMACSQVAQSEEKAKEGQFSLKMDMDLIGSDEHKSQGEAWVDMRNFPPLNESLPFKSVDLSNQTVTVWVYAPAGSIGDKNQPNGFQIFVKDINWNSSYGPWVNVMENEWVQLSFPITESAAQNGYMDQGFDPSQIIAVGIKMGSGGGSTAIYQGPIYIDAVDW
jgi:hypothetical protein